MMYENVESLILIVAFGNIINFILKQKSSLTSSIFAASYCHQYFHRQIHVRKNSAGMHSGAIFHLSWPEQ